ncbi:hypothetical protein A9Q81_20695 [Gammaproteobacteria bacterium 42_54_T18]|nr:hypothetical protein A9Q81_20695 [Gammaproteobacteria bacterium 42_54_T18]
MESLGAPKEIIDELTKVKSFGVFPQNWPVVVWFTQVCDLMRYRTDGACLGLDLPQIESDAKLSERCFTSAHYNGLRIMSKAAARALNKVNDD